MKSGGPSFGSVSYPLFFAIFLSIVTHREWASATLVDQLNGGIGVVGEVNGQAGVDERIELIGGQIVGDERSEVVDDTVRSCIVHASLSENASGEDGRRGEDGTERAHCDGWFGWWEGFRMYRQELDVDVFKRVNVAIKQASW